MDVEEYFKDIAPKGKRSVLEPYWPAIQKARAGGYTLDQIVGFLQNNSIQITRSGLFAFIKRKENKERVAGSIPVTQGEIRKKVEVKADQNGEIEEESAAMDQSSADTAVTEEANQPSLDEVLKSRGAVFDTFEQNRPSIKDRFNKPKGTK